MIYLNGEYMPIEEARIPVLDRGFIFGDGIYEYVPVFDRMPFRLHEHYARLVKSLATVKIPNPFTEAQLGAVVHKLIDAHPWPNQGVYVHITRGVAPRDHSFPPDITPTVFVMSNPLAPTSRKHLEEGLSVVVREDIRWLRCDVKSISLLGHCMLRTEATEEGCDEVILVRDGFLTEASASNILIVSNDMVLSPPRNNLILAGISYDVVLTLLRENNIRHEIRPVTEDELRNAEEIWITSSTKDVLAVTRMDGKAVGTGKPGPLFARVRELFLGLKSKLKAAGHD